MEAPRPSPSFPRQPASSAELQMAAWEDLLIEMRTLAAQVEYIRLMLKLGVRAS